MKRFIKWLLVVLVVLAAAVAGFLGYMGMLTPLAVSESKMGPYLFVYEDHTGPYMGTGKVFDKVYEAVKADGVDTTRGLGIYFDNPSEVPSDKLRSQCGLVVEEKDYQKFSAVGKKYKSKVLNSSDSVVVEFPIRNSLSYAFGPMKAYPALDKYAREKGYKISEPYELYDMPAGKIYFVAPIAK